MSLNWAMSRKDIVPFKKRVTYDGVRRTKCVINMEEAKSETSNEQEDYQPHSDTESAYSTHTKQDTSLNDPSTGPVGLQLLEVHIKNLTKNYALTYKEIKADPLLK
jgi:hypothetical protein